ncbi:hypothetical protein E2C01_102385 [Portunus trituberculatus]|uniref:Uncharacterized protein n=1 Tax=Portunus trituberculatus TaxID=210409 RepID=A0A5B7KMG7_PORTR|nr:hypothetical protein [Portunus trituberculatus]
MKTPHWETQQPEGVGAEGLSRPLVTASGTAGRAAPLPRPSARRRCAAATIPPRRRAAELWAATAVPP